MDKLSELLKLEMEKTANSIPVFGTSIHGDNKISVCNDGIEHLKNWISEMEENHAKDDNGSKYRLSIELFKT